MMIELTYHQPKWAVGLVGSGWCVDRIVLKLSQGDVLAGPGSRSRPTSVGISLNAAPVT